MLQQVILINDIILVFIVMVLKLKRNLVTDRDY